MVRMSRFGACSHTNTVSHSLEDGTPIQKGACAVMQRCLLALLPVKSAKEEDETIDRCLHLSTSVLTVEKYQ